MTHFCDNLPKVIDEVEKLLTRNRIFIDRTEGIVRFPKRMHWLMVLIGRTHVSGIDLDLRKDIPYSGYEKYDFDVPIGTRGDCYDRYLVRIEEVRQSLRIVKQVIDNFPPDCGMRKMPAKFLLHPRSNVEYGGVNSKLYDCDGGTANSRGEVYFEAENPKGALGFYVISKGGGVPYRLKIRAPSFCNLSILEKMVPGHMLSDITVILGSLDFVMGECDR